MLLIEVKNAKDAKDALRIYKEKNPAKGNADGDVFVINNDKKFCYGVIVSENEPNTINYYAVTSDNWRNSHEKEVESFRKKNPKLPKLLAEIVVHYGGLVSKFEKQHPGAKVLLAAGGTRLFYLFITIRGNVKNITDEEVKEHFGISLLDRR